MCQAASEKKLQEPEEGNPSTRPKGPDGVFDGEGTLLNNTLGRAESDDSKRLRIPRPSEMMDSGPGRV